MTKVTRDRLARARRICRYPAGQPRCKPTVCRCGIAYHRLVISTIWKKEDSMFLRWDSYSSVILRCALGVGFLSAVADRLGLWGSFGQPNVEWGNFSRFLEYTQMLNWYVPAGMIPILGVIATAAESYLRPSAHSRLAHTRHRAVKCTSSTDVRDGDDACVGNQGAAEFCRLHRGGRRLASRKLPTLPIQRG